MKISVPNYGEVDIKNIVLDYNGTIAKDGTLKESVKKLLLKLKNLYKIYVITADTHGNAAKNLKDVDVELRILKTSSHTIEKGEFVMGLGNVFALGNGNNDALMLKHADIGVCVIEDEGASVQSLLNADIVCKRIEDALELALKPKRLTATLRK